MVKNHACIAIGINHYQCFAPLNYALHDAEALYNFLVSEVSIGGEGCVLMTDSSPAYGESSTHPNRENILQIIDIVCREKLQKDDLLWFFFSGYGVSYQGQDYLMPAYGDPADIPATGIAMQELFATLKNANSQMVAVLLDINRVSGIAGSEVVGKETLELAKRYEIPTLLSCQSEQFSREARTLRHGLFAACLLDGLRYNRCLNLESLSQYLTRRLPELCEHHNLPIQEPVSCIYPDVKGQWLIWPQNQVVAASASLNGSRNNQPSNNGSRPVSSGPLYRDVGSDQPPLSNTVHSELKNTKPLPSPVPASPLPPVSKSKNPPVSVSPLLWGGAGLLVLLLGVLVGRTAFVSPVPSTAPARPSVASRVDDQKPDPSSVEVSEATPAAVAEKTPKNNNSLPSTAASQKLLDQAVLLVEPVSASRFSYAIAKASQIPPGDALYPEAQQNIQRWSSVILDIAKGRAKQGNFSGAIAAAKLVPKSQEALNQQAQALLGQWQSQFQLQQANQQRLRVASASIRRGSLDSYVRAIASARQIRAGQPSYAQAQVLIGQWGQEIYNIALYRAARGRLSSAIEAASLVPKEAAVYSQAQKSIQQWQRR
ncbi:caspase family protein [Ancylothrix sp. C2]|uniref:caspase family protein n=1 Tax=Ancylothrix sp. D3o TaxID=2953691 RepID=UPI0021BAF170|nr:caspase family protein [Ancylothrix sp. D3o]MCT7950641.1 caspase family protein [Ancylothrix sp. D3o]